LRALAEKKFGEFHLRAHIEFGVLLCNQINISRMGLTSLELMVYASLSIGTVTLKNLTKTSEMYWAAYKKKSRKLLLPTHENDIEFRADKKKEVLY
jgi:hypothetical protein